MSSVHCTFRLYCMSVIYNVSHYCRWCISHVLGTHSLSIMYTVCPTFSGLGVLVYIVCPLFTLFFSNVHVMSSVHCMTFIDIVRL